MNYRYRKIQEDELKNLLMQDGFQIELEVLESDPEPVIWAIHEELNIGVLLEENELEDRWEVVAYDKKSYEYFEKYKDEVYTWPWYGDIEQGYLMNQRLAVLS